MPVITFDANFLVMILGGLVSLIFSFAPNLNTWFAAKPKNYQQLFQAGLMVGITAFIFASGCFAWLPLNDFICDQKTVVDFVYILILAVVANQGVYNATPQTAKVKAVRINRKEKDLLENKYLSA